MEADFCGLRAIAIDSGDLFGPGVRVFMPDKLKSQELVEESDFGRKKKLNKFRVPLDCGNDVLVCTNDYLISGTGFGMVCLDRFSIPSFFRSERGRVV